MTHKIALISLPFMWTKAPPLSIAILKAELTTHGYDVNCFDLNIDAFHHAPDSLKKYWDLSNYYYWNSEDLYLEHVYPTVVEPLLEKWTKDIVSTGANILAVSVPDSTHTLNIIKELKKRIPNILVVGGGPRCSKAYNQISFLPNKTFDVIISGEGEITLIEFLKTYENNLSELPLIPGVNLIKDDMHHYGGERSPVTDLNALSIPDFSDFDLEKYLLPTDIINNERPLNELTIYASRGCLGRCYFCIDHKIWPGKVRYKDPSRVVSEITHYNKNYGTDHFLFVDLMINFSNSWLLEFATLLSEKNLGIYYGGLFRIYKDMPLELFQALKKSGLGHIDIGLESGSNRILKKMCKGSNTSLASKLIKKAHIANIKVCLSLIVGLPDETWLDFYKTVYFVFKHRKIIQRMPSINPCYTIPGSDLYTMPDKFNIRIDPLTGDWNSIDGKNTHKQREKKAHLMRKIISFILK